MVVALLYVCYLIIIGVKSRGIALGLAVLMAVSACYMHPFWLYAFSTKTYRMEGVAHMEGFEVRAARAVWFERKTLLRHTRAALRG